MPHTVLDDLRRSKSRSILAAAVLSLCMGIALIMMAMGESGVKQFERSIAAADPARIIVTPDGGAALNDAAVASFQSIKGVECATGVLVLPLTVKLGRYEAKSLEVTAVDAVALRGKLPFRAGGLFDGQSTAPQFVLGYDAQMEFTAGDSGKESSVFGSGQTEEPVPPPVDWLGKSAQISVTDSDTARAYSGRISGVLSKDGGETDGMAYMNLQAARRLIRENYDMAAALGLKADAYATAFVYARDIGSVKAVTEEIAAMGYRAESAVAGLDMLLVTLGLQRTLLTVIGLFAVLTALLATVCIRLPAGNGRGSEQTGTAKLGPLRERLAYSAVLGLFGGVGAVLLACFFALVTNTSSVETVVFSMRFGQNSMLSIPSGQALLTAGVSVVTALSGGLAAGK